MSGQWMPDEVWRQGISADYTDEGYLGLIYDGDLGTIAWVVYRDGTVVYGCDAGSSGYRVG
jgi:hypothetical protein